MDTTAIFGNPLATEDLGAIGKGLFTVKKRVEISTLHPRQTKIDEYTLALKLAGKFHTKSFVVITKNKNILIDGHHTTAAKKMKGQKFVMALCYLLPEN